jgi:hypothetical protein
LRKKLIVAIAVVAGLGLASSAAFAVTQITSVYSFSPNKANKSAGVTTSYKITDPAAIQPPVNNRIVITFPKGGKWNGAKFPKCNVNSLQQKGPKGCPSKSKIGSGSGVGYAKPVVTDPVQAKLTLFNGGSSVLVYVFPDLGPTFVVTCKVTGGYNLDCSIPPIKTLPSAPDAATGQVDAKTTAKSITKKGKKLGMVITPKKCAGSWKSSATFYFTTGEKVTSPYSQKCKK